MRGPLDVQLALLEVGRQVALASSEEELVAIVARWVKSTFPESFFCLRFSDPRSCELTSLYAEGPLKDDGLHVLVLKRGAAQKTQLSVEGLPPDRVRLVEDEVPLLFFSSARSISAPLVATGQLFGMISVEYPSGPSAAELSAEDRWLVQLTNQVAVAIRNAKLIDELTFVRRYLEELLENANALILVTNRERRIAVFNRQLSKVTGLTRDEVLGQDLLSFVPREERLRVQRVFGRALKGEEAGSFETRLIGRDGQEVRVSFATSSVQGARGTVEGVIAIGQDLTAIGELKRRLLHAEKLASLGQLAASVAHEINNPMTAVVSYAESLYQRAGASGSEQEKLKRILENGRRILRFTSDLMSYARPASEKPEPVDVQPIVETAVGFCDHVLVQHGIQIERRYDPAPKVSAVKGNLVQVFINLITNACQAMGAGGTVSLQILHAGHEVWIRVSDQGCGIPPDLQGKVFDPFFTTKPEGKGTGLGLSIVQEIVEKHGGAIDLTSEVGKGTTFTVRLPVA